MKLVSPTVAEVGGSSASHTRTRTSALGGSAMRSRYVTVPDRRPLVSGEGGGGGVSVVLQPAAAATTRRRLKAWTLLMGAPPRRDGSWVRAEPPLDGRSRG